MGQNQDLYIQIWQTVRSIPCGKVSTYGQIADLAGLPRAARYVGYALKQLPDDTNVPWHRVVTAKGEIAFPKNSKQYKTQRKKLIDEGVLFSNDKINMQRFSWVVDLDNILWSFQD